MFDNRFWQFAEDATIWLNYTFPEMIDQFVEKHIVRGLTAEQVHKRVPVICILGGIAVLFIYGMVKFIKSEWENYKRNRKEQA